MTRPLAPFNFFSILWSFFPKIYKFRHLLIFSLCLALTVGCHSDRHITLTSVSDSPASDRLTVGTILQPRTLDPADSYELASIMVIYNLSDTLYTYELGTTHLKPQLALEMPKISDDGLTYSISLRRGVKFHDGSPFNAQAMAFSLQRFIQNGGKPAFLLADTVDAIQATGEYEIILTLKQPFAAFPALLAFPGTCAVSPKAYEIGSGKFQPDRLVGTGPYQVVSVTSDSIKLDAFQDYWAEKPKNKGIDLQIYLSNPANLYNAFRTKAVDVAYQSLVAQQIEKLKAEQGWQVIEAPGSAVYFLSLNLNSESLQQKYVRQAIAALIDRPLLNERILQGQGEPLYSLIPKTFEGYQPAFQQRYGDRNVTQAKELLQKAGYSAENPVTVEVWHSSSSISSSMVAAVLKALAKRDLDGAIQFEPNSIASAAYFKNVSKGLYASALSNWYPDFLDADNYIYPFLDCAKGSATQGCIEGGAQNQGSFYYSDRMNQLIGQQRREQNPQQRQAILAEIQQMLAEDVPYIPLWQNKDYAFAHNGIEGVMINPSQTFPFWTIHRDQG